MNFIDAGPNVQIVALGDVFKDKLDACRADLKTKRKIEVPDDKCFIGFDSFEKVINDSQAQINSTLITMMGQMSAYSKKDVTWEEMMNSDLYLGPKTYAFGPVDPAIPETFPVIGTALKSA